MAQQAYSRYKTCVVLRDLVSVQHFLLFLCQCSGVVGLQRRALTEVSVDLYFHSNDCKENVGVAVQGEAALITMRYIGAGHL